MKNSVDDPLETTRPPRRSASSNLLIAAAVLLAIILVAWIMLDRGPQEQSGIGVTPAQTIDVDTVTEQAEVPNDDTNPNPVVPQNALIPPAPVDNAPPE